MSDLFNSFAKNLKRSTAKHEATLAGIRVAVIWAIDDPKWFAPLPKGADAVSTIHGFATVADFQKYWDALALNRPETGWFWVYDFQNKERIVAYGPYKSSIAEQFAEYWGKEWK